MATLTHHPPIIAKQAVTKCGDISINIKTKYFNRSQITQGYSDDRFDGICHNFIDLSSIPQQDLAVAAIPGGLPPLSHPYPGSTSCIATTDLLGKN